MKEGKQDYRCESCQNEFSQTYPIAENRKEYEECRKVLKSGYIVRHDDHAVRKISCPNEKCSDRINVTILEFHR